MIKKRQVLAGIFITQCVSFADASACTLSQLQINPIAQGRTDVFIGKSNFIEVQFKSEKKKEDVEVFPEPPLVIKNRKLNTKCSIDGGVWVRKSVYVSSTGSAVLTQEFSGSNDFLNMYDTKSCKKIAEIDVSNSTWQIRGSEITISSQNVRGVEDRAQLIAYHLDASCNPVKSSK